MNQARRAEDFERILLSYTETCFLVALALTSNTEHARGLTREVLVWAWQQRAATGGHRQIKTELLKELRRRFCASTAARLCALNECFEGHTSSTLMASP